jgi:hypothetical protein
MAWDARTRTRPGDARLETVALLLAALTAVVAIARSDGAAREHDRPSAAPRPVSAAAPVAAPAQVDEAEAARQAILRDMLLHD